MYSTEELLKCLSEEHAIVANLTIEEKAALFDNIINCERIRILGTAREGKDCLEGNIHHIGIELWTTYPADREEIKHEFIKSKAKFVECIRELKVDDGIRPVKFKRVIGQGYFTEDGREITTDMLMNNKHSIDGDYGTIHIRPEELK